MSTVILTILLFAGLFFVEKDKNRICGVAQKDEEQIYKLTESKTEVEGFFEVINFAGNPVPYDEGNKTFYISQNMETERWQGKITTDAGRLFFLKDDGFVNKKDFIANNERGKLYLIGQDSYEVFSVCFSGMPIMNIDRERDYVEFIDAETEKIESAEYVGNIEKRGGRSRRYKKKSYKLTFEDKHRLLDMRSDDDWILNALYDDLGLVHNAVSYEVWNQISELNDVPFDNTVSQKYVELLVDGECVGVYGLTERIDSDFVGLKGEDIMYKAFGWPDWETDCMEALECKYPKEETEETRNFVRSNLMDFYTIETSYEALKESVYYENALDYQIFTQLIYGLDNTLKNSYLVYKYDSGERKLALIPWDCNATWGCHFQSYYAPHYIERTDMNSRQYVRLCESDEKTAAKDLYAEWLKLREKVITEENISLIAEENLNYLHKSGAYERNYDRWPYLPEEEEGEPSRIDDEWEDEYIFEFINGHIPVLDQYFKESCE